EEGRDARQRQEPPRAEVRERERHDAEPGAAVVLLDLELRRQVRAQLLRGHAPVREEEVIPGLPHRPAARRDRPRPVLGELERSRLPRSGVEGGHCYRLPRSACSRSIASNSALKLPSPKPRAPCRSITSKKTVGRSCAG